MDNYLQSMPMPMPDIPEDIFAKIVKIVAIDRWWLLGPILKSGRKGKNVVYRDDVLKEACIYSLCSDPSNIQTSQNRNGGVEEEGRYQPFFKRCLDAGNKIAIYYEGLRVVAEERDIKRGISILSQNVPEDQDATLACGVLSICVGDEEKSIYYLQQFGEHHYPLLSEGVRLLGEELVTELSAYKTARRFTYMTLLKYPSCSAIPNPKCALRCCFENGQYSLLYADYDIQCNHCYLWWLANKVSELL